MQTPTQLGIMLRAVVPPLLAIWLVGIAILSIRLAIAWTRLVALLRAAKSVECPGRLGALDQVCGELGLDRTPTLLRSSRVSGPVSTGLLRPCIVLPEHIVERVTDEQFRAIIIHEAAHILRRDQITVLLQQLSMTLFWLHPLIRVLNRRLARAREEICDNYVLIADDASSYSRALLELAQLIQSSVPLPGTVGLFMSRWKLDDRVAGLLDERRSQVTRLSRWSWAFTLAFAASLLAVAVCGTLTLASGQINETATAAATTDDPADNDQTSDPLATNGGGTNAESSAATVNITGRVLTENEPAVGAVVQAWYMGWMGRGWRPTTTEPVATDPVGRFVISMPRSRISGLKIIARTPDSSQFDLQEISYSMDSERAEVRSWLEDPVRLPQFELRLQPALSREVHVIDGDGRPIAEAHVGTYLFSEWAFGEALTSDDGTAIVRIPTACNYYEFFAWKERYSLDYTFAGSAWRGTRAPNNDPASSITLTLGTPADLEIKVVDAVTQQPVPDAIVAAQIPDKPSLRASFAGMQLGYGRSAPTNSDGLARINWLPEWVTSGDPPDGVQQDSLHVWVQHPGYATAVGTIAVGESATTVAVFGEFRLNGRVTHADGSPARGIVVATWGNEETPIDRAVTDNDGHYELKAPPDLGTIVTVVDQTWGAVPQTEFEVERAGASARASDIILQPAKRLYGRVSEVGGNRPVAGQQIWLHLFGESKGAGRWPDGAPARIEDPHATFTTWTDEDGRYEFHVCPGVYSVVSPMELESDAHGDLFARGYSHRSLNLPEAVQEREQNFELELWTAAQPAQNPPRENKDPNPSNPDAAGATSINTESSRIITGRVVDGRGNPIAGASVLLPVNRGFANEKRNVAQGVTGADGAFRLEVPTTWLEPPIWRHEATLWVYQPGFALGTANVQPQLRGADEGNPVEVILPAESNPAFTILDESGNPAVGLAIEPRLYRTVRGYEFVPSEILPKLAGETSLDGEFAFGAIQQGKLFQFRVRSDRHGTQDFRVDTRPNGGELRLRKAVPLRGRVIGDNPAWVRNITLQFTTESGVRAGFGDVVDAIGAFELTTDANGRFEIPLIATGDLQIVEGLDRTLPVRLRLPERVTIPIDEELLLLLSPTTTVRGRVVREGDQTPVPGVDVALQYGQRYQSERAVTDENGVFEARVLPGRISLQVVAIPDPELLSVGRSEQFDIPLTDEPFELPLTELVGTYKKAGRLVDDDNNPLAGWSVWAVSGNRRYGHTTSNDAGEFELQLPNGVDIERYGYNSPNDELGRASVLEPDPLILRPADPVTGR